MNRTISLQKAHELLSKVIALTSESTPSDSFELNPISSDPYAKFLTLNFEFHSESYIEHDNQEVELTDENEMLLFRDSGELDPIQLLVPMNFKSVLGCFDDIDA
jgi:hypothetical protein